MASNQPIGQATGFIAQLTGMQPFLITNRHVVTGRHEDTGKCLSDTLAIPDALVVTHNSTSGMGTYVEETISLFDADDVDRETPRWIEHPAQTKADIVAVPLGDIPERAIFPYDVRGLTENLIEPSSLVNVVGFPFGERTGGFAIWSTGFVASEPQLNHRGEPVFLIDCRSRSGQSGSPVITYTGGHGAFLRPDERNINLGQIHLLGVYSGRISDQSDLGRVWKSWLVAELLAAAAMR